MEVPPSMPEQSGKPSFGLGGDYVADYWLKEQARRFFFFTIRDLCPDVLYSLRDDVLSSYQTWADEQTTPTQGTDPKCRSFLFLEQQAPNVAKLITAWAQRFQLVGEGEIAPPDDPDVPALLVQSYTMLGHNEAVWPSQWATKTLWAWCATPEGKEMMNANPPEWVRTADPISLVGGDLTLEIHFRAFGWLSQREKESEFRRRLHQKLDGVLNPYIENAKQASEMLKGKWNLRKDASHFEWAVLFQIRGQSYRKIKEKYNKSEETVRDGIASVANLIGLKLRAGSRGPRRKTADFGR